MMHHAVVTFIKKKQSCVLTISGITFIICSKNSNLSQGGGEGSHITYN